MKWLLFLIAVLYLISPVDALPGLIDDALVAIVAAGLATIVAMFEPVDEPDGGKR